VRQGGEATYDHLVVADLDNALAAPLAAKTFAKAAHWLDATPTRGGVFANGRPRYYDIWALRHEIWSPNDCWQAVWFRDPDQDQHRLQISQVFSRMVKIPSWLPPIRVLSAFGGIGIYKLQLAIGARYIGLDGLGRETCEHVAFNTAVGASGGQLYVYPSLVTQSPVEHLAEARNLPRRLRPVLIAQRAITALHWWLAVALKSKMQ